MIGPLRFDDEMNVTRTITGSHPIVSALAFYGTRLKHPGQERIHSWFRARLAIDVDAVFDVERSGLQWRLNPHDFIQRNLFWFGEYDRWDVHHFASFAKPGSTIFDVGANFGYYSLAIAARLRGQCRIYAFEPFPRTFALLKHHVRINGFDRIVIPIDVALSDSVGEAVIHEWWGTEQNSGAASLASGPDSKGVSLRPAGSVRINTLDSVVAEYGLTRLELMKIDVEGVEERVLRGGERTLRELRPVILIELHRRQLLREGSSPERLKQMFEVAGYSLRAVDRDRLVPLTQLPDDGQYINAFAIPRERLTS